MTSSESPNPYLSSAVAASNASASAASVGRGLLFGLLFAIVGYLMAMTGFAMVTLARYFLGGYSGRFAWEDFVLDLQWWLYYGVGVAGGCAVLAGLGAVLNYGPAVRLGMVRAMLYVGLSMLAGLMVMGIAATTLDLSPQSYTSDPWGPLRLMIALSIPCTYTFVHTWIRFHIQHIEPGGESLPESESAGKLAPPP